MIVCVHLKPWDGEPEVMFVDMDKLNKAVSNQGLKREEQNEEEIFEKGIKEALKDKHKSAEIPWLYELFTEDDVKHFTVKKFPIQIDGCVLIHVEC